jgi:hypothetical protein
LVVKIFVGNSANATTRREEESTDAEGFESILDIYTRFGGEFTLEDTETRNFTERSELGIPRIDDPYWKP